MKKKEENNLKNMRHSCEHVLTQAMLRLYPKIKAAMGPATDDGYYLDFDVEGDLKISQEDFPKIEKEMAKIIKEDLPIIKDEMTVEEARKFFSGNIYKGNEYKHEWLDEIESRGEKVAVYWMGEKGKDIPETFVDICAGPHVQSTGKIGPFKLLLIAGAYWHGDEKNKMLTRIYGTCFPTQKELDHYLWQIEEAKKRDHRKIGRDLDLFSFHPEAPADVFWHHRGYVIMKEMFKYWREIHDRENYLEVRTPEILTKQIWDQGGHTKFFIEKMYKVTTPEAKEWNMAIKPMNCDGGILIYKTRPRSYKEFPLRMGELGVVHRYESSGETLGILRPREFTQDDAHIYCTPKQVKSELRGIINFCFEVYQTFGLELDHLELSTKPKNHIGSDAIWKKAESIMKEVLKEGKTPYQINEGEGAFYGPKFDFHLKDAIGRTWQCSTIQLDFAQPENFDLEYTNEKGKKERPVMIHRVLYGSVERFLGILIENFSGAFPVWLSPVQVVVLPVSEKTQDYAQEVFEKIKNEDIRVEIEVNQTLSYRIRQWELQKVPYILVIGEKEEKNQSVTIRKRQTKKLEELKLSQFISQVKEKISSRSLLV